MAQDCSTLADHRSVPDLIVLVEVQVVVELDLLKSSAGQWDLADMLMICSPASYLVVCKTASVLPQRQHHVPPVLSLFVPLALGSG